MCDCMTFPDTVDEFMEQYKVVDTDGIYMSKGAELVPIFRMRQWFEHIPSAQPEIVRCKDCKHNQLPATSGNANCEIFYGMTDQDGFCHMAERRTDDQT